MEDTLITCDHTQQIYYQIVGLTYEKPKMVAVIGILCFRWIVDEWDII